MSKRSDSCSQLRKLHNRLVEEVKLLRESLQGRGTYDEQM